MHRRRRFTQEGLECLAGRDVEVVGRLVEQQQVRAADSDERELEARTLPAGEDTDFLEHVIAA